VPPKKYTAEDLIQRLRNKFGESQRYALFEQVANGTGWAASSWVDAIVVYLWPSDGLTRCAFEVKASRSDFLNELQNPGKNEWARQMCHEFWFVASKTVIKEEELPEGVGWMRPHGDGLAIVRHASRTTAEMDAEFVASICRSIQKSQKREESEIRKKVLEESLEYQDNLRFRHDVETFVRSHGGRPYEMQAPGGVEEVLDDLMHDPKAKHEVEQIRHVLRDFQRKMCDLFNLFLPVAYMSLVETDDLGNFLVDHYNENDPLTIAEKRALLKLPKKDRTSYWTSEAERAVAVFDRLRRLLGETG